ncbi:MAG: Coq4 family protein [Flavobacteriaceae bacterium]
MQSTFKNIRKKFLKWIFENAQIYYVRLLRNKREPWNINLTSLLQYPSETFGHQYAQFLKNNKFEILKNFERHDAYHVITGCGRNVEDEIAMQYLCLGNGKLSVNLIGVLILGTILLPEYWKYYLKSYRIGKNANQFYNWDFEKILDKNLSNIQLIIFNKTNIS